MNKLTDIKEIVASNLVRYRKEAKLTQSQAAEKLNYSDKAISKWERGESLPDVYVLKQIADVYGVDIDDMLHEATAMEKIQSFYRNRAVASILSVLLVWLVAMLGFVAVEIAIPNQFPSFLCFIYAIPVSAIVALVFNSLWGGRIYNMIIVTILDWGIAFSIVVSCERLISNSADHPWWYIYFIAAIFEVMTILWYLLNIGGKKRAEKEEKKHIVEPIVKNEMQMVAEVKPEEEIDKTDKSENQKK